MGTAEVVDVTDDAAVAALADQLDRVDVLVNNAGGAKGTEPVADADLEHWRWMWETNVLGTLRVTRALLPKLIESGDGLIVTVTSIAAFETYDGGAGYTAAKHAQSALHRTLRGELLGKPVRLTEIAPGMVETEFSVVRFGGDRGQGRRGLCGHDPAGGRGHRRGDRFRGVAPAARQPGPDRDPAPRPGQRHPQIHPPGWGAGVVVVVVGVPDNVGASLGVAGALAGIPSGACGLVADIDCHLSQSTAQSQMSPSA